MNANSPISPPAGTASAPAATPPRFPLGLLFLVWFTVVVVTILVTLVLPEAFGSTARIKIERDHTDIPGFAGPSSVVFPYDPYFLQTECGIIQSETILAPVIHGLNLNEVWGQRYFDGTKFKTSETLALLRNQVDLRPVANTSLVDIRVFSDSPTEAAALANRIAESYQQWRINQARQLAEESLRSLANQIEETEAHIARARKELDPLTNPAEQSQSPSPTQPGLLEKQKDLEEMQDLRRLLTRRMNLEAIDLRLPRSEQVMLIERAVPGTKPLRPNVPLTIWLGILAGGCLGLLLATLVYLLQRRVFRRQSGGATTMTLTGLRTTLRTTIALTVGVIVGYNCAMPMSTGSLLLTQFLVFLGGIMLAYVELARPTPLPTSAATTGPPGQTAPRQA